MRLSNLSGSEPGTISGGCAMFFHSCYRGVTQEPPKGQQLPNVKSQLRPRRWAACLVNATMSVHFTGPSAAYRTQRGETVQVTDYSSRFPEAESELRKLLTDAERAETKSYDEVSAAVPPRNLKGEFGDYEILEEVARGGMGVVYRLPVQPFDKYSEQQPALLQPVVYLVCRFFRPDVRNSRPLWLLFAHRIPALPGDNGVTTEEAAGPESS